MVRDGVKPKTIYDSINNNTGGVYFSASQSNELRDSKHVYRQSQLLIAEKKCGNENYDKNDELIATTELQREKKDFIQSVSCSRNSYYMFFVDDVQLNDVVFFCVDKNGVLSIDTTFNLCSNWATDTCYENTRLQTQNGKHPFFLGSILIHFEKMLSSLIGLPGKCAQIGTDQEMAIYNSFASQIPDLNLLLCVFHLQKSDERKIFPQKGASRKIIADIYGCQYGDVRKYGLADSTDKEDLEARLRSLEERWELLCPGFYK